MKIIGLFALMLCLNSPSVMARSFETTEAKSYLILLDRSLNQNALDECVHDICSLSGDGEFMECKIVSKGARIMAASLSNTAVRILEKMSCVESFRLERFDFEPRPRSGRSN